MVKKKPRVSIIMNCHNGAKYLEEALQSICAQDYKNWEIVFWDNASTDKSASIANGYDKRLRYIFNPEKVSLGRARNKALKECRGEYICFLDVDDMWLPGKLSKQVVIMDSNAQAALLYSNAYYQFEERGTSHLIFTKPQKSGKIFEECVRKYPINLQTVMLRKSALRRLNGDYFDEAFELCEEADLFLRILFNEEGLYVNEPTVVYRVHNEMSSLQNRSRYINECERMLAKLITLDTEESYKAALTYYKAKIGYWKAREKMDGKWKHAWKDLQPFKWTAPEFMVLYITSFFGPWFWRILHYSSKQGPYI